MSTKNNYLFVIISACVLLSLSFGLRSAFGLYMEPLSTDLGWGREVYSLAIAIQNIVWGVGAVIAGTLADRYGNVRIIIGGALLYALGLWFMPQVTEAWQLNLSAGALVGAGVSGTAFGIVLPAMARAAGPERRQLVMGIGTAAGSFGQFLIVPVVQSLIGTSGWQASLVSLSVLALLMIPLALPLAPYSGAQEALQREDGQQQGAALTEAFGHFSYILLIFGFFVCGFQLAFLTAHLPAFLHERCSIENVGAISLSIIGLSNVVGAYFSGKWSGIYSKKWMLSIIYALRALVFALFILVEPTFFAVILFSVATGLLWLATIPPTSGLVAQMFGTRYMAMLYGIVFFSHQIGSFLGVYLGGYFYDTTGNYDLIWWLGIVIAIITAIIHIPIDERPVERLRTVTQ